MFAYDKTFDPKVVLCHCDLISWLCDFALYLDTHLVYLFILFQIMNKYDQTFDREVLIGRCDVILRFSDFCLISRHSIGM